MSDPGSSWNACFIFCWCQIVFYFLRLLITLHFNCISTKTYSVFETVCHVISFAENINNETKTPMGKMIEIAFMKRAFFILRFCLNCYLIAFSLRLTDSYSPWNENNPVLMFEIHRHARNFVKATITPQYYCESRVLNLPKYHLTSQARIFFHLHFFLFVSSFDSYVYVMSFSQSAFYVNLYRTVIGPSG